MDISFAFICDYADITGPKINALGIGFDTIYAPQIPHTHPLFHLVAMVRAHAAEAGQKDLLIRLMDADGKDVIPEVRGTFDVPSPSSGVETFGKIHVTFAGVTFNKHGAHSLHVIIQGNEMVRVPLRVAAPPTTT